MPSDASARPATLADDAVAKMEKIISDLRAVPVNVEIKVVPVQESGEPIDMPAEELPVRVNPVVDQPVKKEAVKKKAS